MRCDRHADDAVCYTQAPRATSTTADRLSSVWPETVGMCHLPSLSPYFSFFSFLRLLTIRLTSSLLMDVQGAPVFCHSTQRCRPAVTVHSDRAHVTSPMTYERLCDRGSLRGWARGTAPAALTDTARPRSAGPTPFSATSLAHSQRVSHSRGLPPTPEWRNALRSSFNLHLSDYE